MSSVNKDPIKEIERNLDTAPLPTFPCAAPFEPVPWMYPAEPEATSAPVPRVGGMHKESAAVAASPVAPESQTIDSPAFQRLLSDLAEARWGDIEPARNSIIRYIDARLAAQVARPLPTAIKPWRDRLALPFGDSTDSEIFAVMMGEIDDWREAAAVGALPVPAAQIDNFQVNNTNHLDLDKLETLALATGGVSFELEGFEQIEGRGQFYGGLIMSSDGATIVAQCVLQPWADFIAAADPATILRLVSIYRRSATGAALPAPVVATPADLLMQIAHYAGSCIAGDDAAADRYMDKIKQMIGATAAVEVARQPDEPSTFSHSSNPLEHMPTMGARYAYYVKHPDGSHSYAVPQPTLLKPEYRNGCFAAPSSQAAPTYAGRVPLSVDGKSVFIDGVGDVALNYDAASSQAAPDAKAEEARLALYWKAGFEGEEICATTRGQALAAYAEGVKAREAASQAAPVELTDEKIEPEAKKYALYVRPNGDDAPGDYDVTKYEVREDFFNCVRACIRLAAQAAQKGA